MKNNERKPYTKEDQSLNRYLQEINEVELLTVQEEVELTRLIKQGNQDALEKLTKANLRFVVSVAKKYQNQGLPLGDLINEGNLGLIKAVKRFDETKGFKFISYAVWWIRQAILQALVETSRIVKLPTNRVYMLRIIDKTSIVLEQTLGREPSVNEIADELELNPDVVIDTINRSECPLSLYEPLEEYGGNCLLDLLISSHPEIANFEA